MLESRNELRPYQIDGINWLIGGKRKMIGDEPGLGKTPQGAFAAHDVAPNSTKIIVAPTYACYMWRDSLNKWFPDETVDIAQGSAQSRFISIISRPKWLILNTEMLRHRRKSYSLRKLRAATDYVPASV